MFIVMNVHLTKEITEYGTFDAKLHATITDVQESGNSMFRCAKIANINGGTAK